MKLMTKSLVCCALGYAVYEFIRHFVGSQPSRGGQVENGSGNLRQAIRNYPAAQNVTGPGEGTVVRTEDFSGTSTPHVVGRGVVRR